LSVYAGLILILGAALMWIMPAAWTVVIALATLVAWGLVVRAALRANRRAKAAGA